MVGERPGHQQLFPPRQPGRGQSIDDARHIGERRWNSLIVAFLGRQQSAQVGSAWLVRRRSLQEGQVLLCLGIALEVDIKAGSRHSRIHMLRVERQCLVVRCQRTRHVEGSMQYRGFHIPGGRVLRRQFNGLFGALRSEGRLPRGK